jgi:hypothetical protein
MPQRNCKTDRRTRIQDYLQSQGFLRILPELRQLASIPCERCCCEGGFWVYYKRAWFIPNAALVLLITACAKKDTIPATGPTPVPLTWSFGGSSGDLIPTTSSSPVPVALPVYKNITATLQFGVANTASVTVSVSDALNNGDVSPNTVPTDNATSGATPFLYLSFYNGTSTTVSFGSSTPAIQLTDTAGFGITSNCEVDDYANNAWTSSGATGTVSGTSVTINSAALANSGTFQFLPGQTIAAIACK